MLNTQIDQHQPSSTCTPLTRTAALLFEIFFMMAERRLARCGSGATPFARNAAATASDGKAGAFADGAQEALRSTTVPNRIKYISEAGSSTLHAENRTMYHKVPML